MATTASKQTHIHHPHISIIWHIIGTPKLTTKVELMLLTKRFMQHNEESGGIYKQRSKPRWQITCCSILSLQLHKVYTIR